jgi:hypothetical protein
MHAGGDVQAMIVAVTKTMSIRTCHCEHLFVKDFVEEHGLSDNCFGVPSERLKHERCHCAFPVFALSPVSLSARMVGT